MLKGRDNEMNGAKPNLEDMEQIPLKDGAFILTPKPKLEDCCNICGWVKNACICPPEQQKGCED